MPPLRDLGERGRDLTEAEKGDLRYGCIFCKQNIFWLGPQGGLSFNVFCSDCLAGFNVTHAKLPWQLIAEPYERKAEELAPILDGKMSVIDFFHHLDAAIEKSMREGFDRLLKARGKPPLQ